MSYNWTKADTAEARERLKARLDQGTVIARRIMAEIDGKPMYSNPIELWMQNGEYFTSDSVMKNPFTVTHKHVWNLEFLDPVPACPPLKWVKSDKYKAWTAEIFGIFYSIHLCTDGTYRAGSIGPKPQWFPTLEEAKAACEDHWEKYWEEEMKAAKG